MTKEVDDKRFKKDIGNRMLLWHGSRLTNFVGIISQGLRIAPPEAPVTGYMFGKVSIIVLMKIKRVFISLIWSQSPQIIVAQVKKIRLGSFSYVTLHVVSLTINSMLIIMLLIYLQENIRKFSNIIK